MTAHDFQVSLGFDLVTHFHPNGGEVRLIREGDGERESTLAERVLWDQMLVLLYALQYARNLIGPDSVLDNAIAKATGQEGGAA